ncbi:MAG: hypothetical protein R2752_19475 [Vicinamibacterales bacterium]
MSNSAREQGTIWLGALAGAVAGGIVAYLFFTERGRALREDLAPHLSEIVDELGKARTAATRAREAVNESWQSVRDMDAALRGGPVPR